MKIGLSKILFAIGALTFLSTPILAQGTIKPAIAALIAPDVSSWGISDAQVQGLSDTAILSKINFAENRAKIEKAAANGDSNAMYFMGLFVGSGAMGDAQKANIWFKKAAVLNNKYALYTLGYSIIGDATTLKDASPAIKYYEKAASLNHIAALVELGRLYNKGTELPIARDMKKSFAYYNLAIALGSEQAKIDLAYIYLEGQGVKADKAKAKGILIGLAKSNSETGELARNSLLEEFNIDCTKNPAQCK